MKDAVGHTESLSRFCFFVRTALWTLVSGCEVVLESPPLVDIQLFAIRAQLLSAECVARKKAVPF